jgi:hypothetical protein
MMLSKCFGRVQRLLLWDVSMLLPRNSHPQLYQNALATFVEASSSANPNFSINNCLDVLAEVEVASTRSVFKNLLFLQFLGNNGIVFVSEGKMEITIQTHTVQRMAMDERCGYGWNEILNHPCASPCNKSNSFRIYVGWIWLKQIKYIVSKIESKMFCLIFHYLITPPFKVSST